MSSTKRSYIEKVAILTAVLIAGCLATGIGLATAFGAEGGALPAGGTVGTDTQLRWDLALGVAISIAFPCLAAGYAVGKVGAAALGAASEKPELLTRSLLFVALAEGIAIYGLLIAILLYTKL